MIRHMISAATSFSLLSAGTALAHTGDDPATGITGLHAHPHGSVGAHTLSAIANDITVIGAAALLIVAAVLVTRSVMRVGRGKRR